MAETSFNNPLLFYLGKDTRPMISYYELVSKSTSTMAPEYQTVYVNFSDEENTNKISVTQMKCIETGITKARHRESKQNTVFHNKLVT